MSDRLNKQDRIWLHGGYDMDPKWLRGKKGYFGKVISFIPGQNDSDAAVVELEESITIDDVTGNIVVLELRYAGAKWKSRETVHIELCDFIPEARRWQERRQGKWIESHASYEKV
ncbi:MAG: hypothetical protein PVH82_05120 [Desulfobacteraceae bacterium]|jgi:hypothetical protein